MSVNARVAPPMVTVIEVVNEAIPVASCPGATAGLTAPKPVPKRETTSPALAGDAPVTTLESATSDPVPASSAAMLVELGNTKNAGQKVCNELSVGTAVLNPFPLPGSSTTLSV